MTNKEKLTEATILALQGKLTENLDNIKENEVDEVLKYKDLKVAKGPNRYVYAICEYLRYITPQHLEKRPGGVRLRFFTTNNYAAEQVLKDIKEAGKHFNIPILNAQVKWTTSGCYAYCIIPRYEG